MHLLPRVLNTDLVAGHWGEFVTHENFSDQLCFLVLTGGQWVCFSQTFNLLTLIHYDPQTF